MASHLRLYNTLTRQLESLRPRDPRRITFYSCGPTVYDDAHIGNFRSFLAADVLRRFLESPLCRLEGDGGGSRRVVHVMNITDVGHMTDDADADGGGEDKMQAAARRLVEAKKSGKLPPGAEGVDPTDQLSIARFYEARFKEDARKLGLKVAIEAEKDPTLMPRATESVSGMIAVIGRLVARGHAYAVGPAGRQTVYFAVQSFPRYGALSGNTLEALRSGEGGRVSEAHQAEKRHPGDFLLWKSDPSHAMRWPSPWGEGYPGWHIECSAMSAARLLARDGAAPLSGPDLERLVIEDAAPMIDLHSGGEDNIFPHHECEIAQSCCAFNAAPGAAEPGRGMYAAHWFHPRFLMVEGAKMSKSKGNFFTARDLFAKGHEPAAVRLELIKTHYRSNANFTEQGLKDSARLHGRLIGALSGLTTLIAAEPLPKGITLPWDEALAAVRQGAQRFADAMHDDLNVALATAELQTTVDTMLKALRVAPMGHYGKRPSGWIQDRNEMRASPYAGAQCHTLLVDMLDVLGITDCADADFLVTELATYYPPAEPTAAVNALLEERRAARAAKDFTRSDSIRDELARLGYAIKDVAGGKVEVRKG